MNKKNFKLRGANYIGNHPNGKDHIYVDERPELLAALGLQPAKKDDTHELEYEALAPAMYNEDGITTINGHQIEKKYKVILKDQFEIKYEYNFKILS